MQKDHAFFDDLSKMVSGATGAFADMKRELEAAIHAKMESWLSSMNLVTREEFDVVREMAQAARVENEALKARIDELSKKISD